MGGGGDIDGLAWLDNLTDIQVSKIEMSLTLLLSFHWLTDDCIIYPVKRRDIQRRVLKLPRARAVISWLRVLADNISRYIPPPSGEHKTGLQDQEIFNLRSTCHTALDRCERDSDCRYEGGTDGRYGRDQSSIISLLSSDLTWSLSRLAVRTPAAETDACPQ